MKQKAILYVNVDNMTQASADAYTAHLLSQLTATFTDMKIVALGVKTGSTRLEVIPEPR